MSSVVGNVPGWQGNSGGWKKKKAVLEVVPGGFHLRAVLMACQWLYIAPT
jgi:hypothetical protein